MDFYETNLRNVMMLTLIIGIGSKFAKMHSSTLNVLLSLSSVGGQLQLCSMHLKLGKAGDFHACQPVNSASFSSMRGHGHFLKS